MRTTIFSAALLAGALSGARADTPSSTPATLDVKSSAFTSNEGIPSQFTCDGTETSPPLSWSTVPTSTKSIALLVDDPDAPNGTVVHWLVTDISPTRTSLQQGASLPMRAHVAKNMKGKEAYAGPCPPSGRHSYHFHVYALDIPHVAATTRSELMDAMRGHIVAQGELIGTYERAANKK